MGVYRVVAKNYSAATENRIHSDEIAQKFGFEGALVPGVAVFGYMTHPLVQKLGEAWLNGSESSVRFLKPAYDQRSLTITTDTDNGSHFVRCRDDGDVLLAELRSSMSHPLPAAEDQRIFEQDTKSPGRPEIAWDNVRPEEPFAEWHLQITEDGNRTYCEQIDETLGVYRYAAHPHWLLSIANRSLTREYTMPTWIHAGSEIRLREIVRVGDTLSIRAVPLEKWERKGHEFVKLYLAYHRDDVLTTEIFHTAIFKVAA